MKIFIGWSKENSKRIAEQLRDMLLHLFDPNLELFMSAKDVSSGVDWEKELYKELEQSSFGIICFSGSNRFNPWLFFEAGFLKANESEICPYLHDLSANEIPSPLRSFQSAYCDEESTLKMILDINKKLGNQKGHNPEILKDNFKHQWQDFEKRLRDINANYDNSKPEELIAKKIKALEEIIKVSIEANLDRVKTQKLITTIMTQITSLLDDALEEEIMNP